MKPRIKVYIITTLIVILITAISFISCSSPALEDQRANEVSEELTTQTFKENPKEKPCC